MVEWPCIAIGGPTATGKTALACELAHLLGTEIFSIDSRQVYRGLNIGTGKDLVEYSRFTPPIRHHLIDIVEPQEVYGLYRFQADAYQSLERFRTHKGIECPPIMAGGTGLYLEALIRHFDIPHTPENPKLRAELMGLDIESLKNQLLMLSPEVSKRTDFSSKKRIVRSLEVAMHSDTEAVNVSPHPSWRFKPMLFITQWDRAFLRNRIAERLRNRLDGGLVQEVVQLRSAGISWERFNLLGMEYRQVASYLRGEKNLATMESDLLHEIHLLAKRQETYFRGFARRGIPVHSIGPQITAADLVLQFEEWKKECDSK